MTGALPRMVPVLSSNIESVGYEAASHSLYVKFKSGGLYCYSGVPESLHRGIVTAESVGTFLAERIKPNYPARRVEKGT